MADLILGGLVVFGLVAVALFLPDDTPDTLTGRAHAMDGDSLRLEGHELRLQGIDAPEFAQTCQRDGRDWACGVASRDALRSKLGGTITCETLGRDRFDRILARCAAGNAEINAAMVAEGWAVDYGGYGREEAEARAARRGIWASEFDEPVDWRAMNER